jgi:uncharacterized protein YdhG (YjbR/CyaY superfamily)
MYLLLFFNTKKTRVDRFSVVNAYDILLPTMNMFKAVKATSVKEYFAALPKERREALTFLHTFIQKTAPSLKSNFIYNMPGYGRFSYRNAKKELLDWPVIALASQKNYISLYICAVDHGEYIAEKNKKELGKVSVGKSCIRFKKIEDLNLKTLAKIIKSAAKSPGLVGVGAR